MIATGDIFAMPSNDETALAAPEPQGDELPWDRARRLARELAGALDTVGGHQRAIIMPASRERYPVLFEEIDLGE